MDKTVQDLLNKLMSDVNATIKFSNPEQVVRESLKDADLPESVVSEIVAMIPEIMAEFIENPQPMYRVVEDICTVDAVQITDKLVPGIPAVLEKRSWHRVCIEITIANVRGSVGTAAVTINGEEMLSGSKEVHFSDIARKHLIKEIGNEHFVTDEMVINMVKSEYKKYTDLMSTAGSIVDLLSKLIKG